MKKATLFILFLVPAFTVFSQSYFGFQLDMGNRNLNGISPGATIYHPTTSTTPEFYISPSFRYRKLLNRTLSLEAGLGCMPLVQHIRLKNSIYSTLEFDKTLKIKLHYLTIPLSFNYSIPVRDNSSLLFTGSMMTGFLISYSDNYNDVSMTGPYYIGNNRYSIVVFTSGLSAAYQFKVRNCGIVEPGFYISRDMTPWIKNTYSEGGGYFGRLYPSRSIRYGFKLKYFLNT